MHRQFAPGAQALIVNAEPTSPLLGRLVDEIRREGPITVARFMSVALYDPEHGYYARAQRRSGQAGDFYTSVDVSALFGRVLARLVAETWVALGRPARFDIVEAGASDGRLARDVLEGLSTDAPDCLEAARLALVERSASARAAQEATLGPHAHRLAASGAELPAQVDGILYANELLDAFPVHRVRVTRDELEERYVAESGGVLALVSGPPSTPELCDYFRRLPVQPAPGTVVDVSLEAIEWSRLAGTSLARGRVLLIDYGHDARALYSASHAGGTLRAYSRHVVDPPPRQPGRDAAAPKESPAWLSDPGERDLTAHVDFTAVELALARSGLARHAWVDQTRLLLALGLAGLVESAAGTSLAQTRVRLAAQALISPEGLGASHRALLMGAAGVPSPRFDFRNPWSTIRPAHPL